MFIDPTNDLLQQQTLEHDVTRLSFSERVLNVLCEGVLTPLSYLRKVIQFQFVSISSMQRNPRTETRVTIFINICAEKISERMYVTGQIFCLNITNCELC